MEIKNITVNSTFKYIWLKTVTDVDLSKHCAACLIGEYDSRINPRITHLENIALSDSVYYLCGVSFPFNWANNFHLAFKASKGDSVRYESNGISIEIKDAIQLPISQAHVDINHPKAKTKSYNTCRNWQFAHYFNDNLKSS